MCPLRGQLLIDDIERSEIDTSYPQRNRQLTNCLAEQLLFPLRLWNLPIFVAADFGPLDLDCIDRYDPLLHQCREVHAGPHRRCGFELGPIAVFVAEFGIVALGKLRKKSQPNGPNQSVMSVKMKRIYAQLIVSVVECILKL